MCMRQLIYRYWNSRFGQSEGRTQQTHILPSFSTKNLPLNFDALCYTNESKNPVIQHMDLIIRFGLDRIEMRGLLWYISQDLALWS